MKNIIKLGLTLGLYAVVSCALLAVVNNWTAPKIEAIKAAKTAEGLKIVFADADNYEVASDSMKKVGTAEILEVYTAFRNGSEVGHIIKASGPTYDRSTILIGLDLAKKITGVVFLECSDSPGFGQKAADRNYATSSGTTFYGQFAGVDASKNLKAGTDFEAISGATITSKGVEALINHAVSVLP